MKVAEGMRGARERLSEPALIEQMRSAINSRGRRAPVGGRLDEIVRRQGPLDQWMVVSVIRSIAAALDERSGGKVPHGDLSPRTIVVNEQGAVTLTGLPAPDESDVRYVAPERLTGARASARSDVYALGLVAYEMIAGRPAHAPSDDPRRLRASVVAGVPRLRDEVTGVAAIVSDVVARATALDAEDRYASAWDFARELAMAFRSSDRTEVLSRPNHELAPHGLRADLVELAAVIKTYRPDVRRLSTALPMGLIILGALVVWIGPVQTSAAPAPMSARTGAAPTAAIGTAPSARATASVIPSARAQPAQGLATPNVLGLTLNDAATLLRSAGFRNEIDVTVVWTGIARAGSVVRQEPAAGAAYRQGQRATLYVMGPLPD